MMLRRIVYILFVVLLLPLGKLNAQGVLIGRSDNSTNPYAKLEIYSTTSGLLIPRVTTEQMEAIDPDETAISLLVYNTDKEMFMFFNGDEWEHIWSGDAGLNIDELINDALSNIDFVDWNSFNRLIVRHESDSSAMRDSLLALREKILTETSLLLEKIQNLRDYVESTYVTKQELTDSLDNLRAWVEARDSIKQTTKVVATLSDRPNQGTYLGDVVIVEDNGSGYREVFIWADLNNDNTGDEWQTIDKSAIETGYDIYWFKRPEGKNAYDPSIFTSPVSTGATAFNTNGYQITTSEDFEGEYVFAYPDIWGKPQFLINRDGLEYPIIDGMRMYTVEIDGIKYQVWTLFMDMTSTYSQDLKFKALN